MGVKYNPRDIAGRMDRASVIERIGSEEQVEKRVVVMTPHDTSYNSVAWKARDKEKSHFSFCLFVRQT
jgi:hypothetical protein